MSVSDKINGEERMASILCAIVESYIETEEPVGSRTLSRVVNLGLSPATIRNVMADLTDQGYLDQPHTSAGRVPTALAYRFYVDKVAGQANLSAAVRDQIAQGLAGTSLGLSNLLTGATRMLARLTHFTSLVTSPRVSLARLERIQFIRVNHRRILAVLITQSNMVYHKLLNVSENVSQEFLDDVAAYLCERFSAASLEDMRDGVLEQLVKEKESYAQLLAHAVRLSKRALDLAGERELYVDGQSHLILGSGDAARVQRMMLLLEEKSELIALLDKGLPLPGPHITIGGENLLEPLENCTLVAANYGNGDHVLGTIGVIGPTHMDYSRIIPVIGETARSLSQAIAGQ